MARIYQKGQVILPKGVRDQAGFAAGDEVIVEARGNEIVLRRPVDLLNYTPRGPRRELGLSSQQAADAAWDEHVELKYAHQSRL